MCPSSVLIRGGAIVCSAPLDYELQEVKDYDSESTFLTSQHSANI